MKLSKLFPCNKLGKDLSTRDITGVSDDSRLVKKGDIFFIIEKEGFDIFPVLKKIESLPAVFAAGKENKNRVLGMGLKKPVIFFHDIKKEFIKAADLFYGFNPGDFKCIGVTGTKGKTTTAYFIYSFLKMSGLRASFIGTTNYLIADKVFEAPNTTPGMLTLRNLFGTMKKRRQDYAVMEVSSHALSQGRTEGVDFGICIFTNLSREHLDYHKTMNDYFKAKEKLFLENKKAVSIVNNDDHYGRIILKNTGKSISFGILRKADFRASGIRLDKNGSQFRIEHGKDCFSVKSPLIGKHNIYNILAGSAGLYSMGFKLKEIAEFIPCFKGVEGRLQAVSPDIFVDYAHTHDSLKKALKALNAAGYKKIICVFGCGGGRDKGKRRLMGKVSSNLAYFTFITSDNPRYEDPMAICRSIEKGFCGNNNYKIEPDRWKAIREAVILQRKEPGGCLLVAGKGHENYQVIGDKKIPFNDKKNIHRVMALFSAHKTVK